MKLQCKWCSNPESLRKKPELFYHPEKCIGCKVCINECPQDAIKIKENKIYFQRDLCQNCGKCTRTCYSEARVMKGYEMEVEVEEVIKAILEDEVFYENSDGGVTLGGGDSLVQV